MMASVAATSLGGRSGIRNSAVGSFSCTWLGVGVRIRARVKVRIRVGGRLRVSRVHHKGFALEEPLCEGGGGLDACLVVGAQYEVAAAVLLRDRVRDRVRG